MMACIQLPWRNHFNLCLFVYYTFFSFEHQTAVLLWMPDPATRDAMIIKKALGNGLNYATEVNDLKCATEVICSRTPSQIQMVKQIYFSKYHVQLEHDIENHTSGDHKKVKSPSLLFWFCLFCSKNLSAYGAVMVGCLVPVKSLGNLRLTTSFICYFRFHSSCTFSSQIY